MSESQFHSLLEKPQIEKPKQQITFERIEDRFGKILVHALPDGQIGVEEVVEGFTTNPPFEEALDRCLQAPIENLCCSSVSQGDEYNRWGGTPFGLYMMDGDITACNNGDLHSRHKSIGETVELPSTKEIIQNMRPKGQRTIDEIQVRTKPESIIPYFDLDLVQKDAHWGFERTSQFGNNSIDLDRYLAAMDVRSLPNMFLYRGKIGSIDVNKLRKIIEPIKYGLSGEDGVDYEKDENYRDWQRRYTVFKEQLAELFTPLDRDGISQASKDVIHRKGVQALNLLKRGFGQQFKK